MRRRNFLLLGGSLALWPPVVMAQPSSPSVGFMFIADRDRAKWWVDAWNTTMGESGFMEGRNLVAEYRWGHGDPSKMSGFAADLVARRAAVIVTTSEQALTAAKEATSTIPIVFNYIADPVGKGFVTSVTHPGGNITGIEDVDEAAMESKRLQLLQELMPAVTRVGHLIAEQDVAIKRRGIDAVAAAGKKLGMEVVLLTAGRIEELDAVFTVAGQRGVGAVLVGSPSTFLYARQKRILETAARYKMPLASGNADFAVDGGLMQYGLTRTEVPILTANYVVRILKGQKPAELPVQKPTRFAFSLNLKTAKALGLAFSPGLIARADNVIE